MQKTHQRQSKSPLVNNKVIRTKTQHTSKDESINLDNSIKDQTLEKLFLQLDQLRRRHEQEKKEMNDTFNYQLQIKSNQLQKSAQEFQQKNLLLESLLFQEQAKTIHLTKIIQEKQKSTALDQEKEQYKNKIQQLESILQDSQRKNQIIPNKLIQKDTSFKILIEIINKVSTNILRLIKDKNTILSWIDQEILEIDILKQKDLNKSLLKLNTIFEKFFVSLQERETLSLSPYKIATKNNNQTINTEKPTATTIPTQKSKVKMMNSETQTKVIQNKISNFQQTDKIDFKSKLTQTDFLNVQNEGKIEQAFEKQKLQVEPQKQKIKEQKSKKNCRIQQLVQISILLQCPNRTSQIAKPKLISSEVQTDQIQDQQLKIPHEQKKHYSKITEYDEEENELSKDESKKNSQKEDNNGADSSFDCNKPDYDSDQENDKMLIIENKYYQFIINFESAALIIKFVLHYSLQDLITNKWSIKLKDHNATLKYSIGILSQSSTFLTNMIKSIYGVDQQIQFDLNQIAIQYYDSGFQENYRLEIIIKQLEFPSQFLINSAKIQERQEFQHFWIDFMIQQCNLFIYLVQDFNEDDQRIIKYLQDKNKKVAIISYDLNDYTLDNFDVFNNYKYNIDLQIIKIQNNQNILQSLWRDILQSDWEWEEVYESILVQLQQFISQIVENDDCIHLQIKEDGIFEISLMIDEIAYDYLLKIPYVKNKETLDKEVQVLLELPEKKRIQEVKCIGNQILIVIDRFILLEQCDQLIQLNSINNNLILLTIIQ
ncbi:unnamed protein product (macronuclear) [Paramecium tetraurelia]|uniref:Uncharacterized protein n=1 Tax=Paramecium tetraurelia TaxID=5888 RepID=A0DP67_PARTE|nr:uncharacterized protein GSPATT00019016001 [Paramecium tetraurelia]CAK84834.1 unnamed protein product [Paramecium tetraurelia]|eukprot:XP_001452231.1 hypothetical protein (macronuclear) [Paramecium tetraurelia strain d4-2]